MSFCLKFAFFVTILLIFTRLSIQQADTGSNSSVDFRCDYKRYNGIDGLLKLHQNPVSWHEAQLRCYMEGSILASPLTNVLTKTMIELIKDKKIYNSKIFTGIHSMFSRGNMKSVEGVTLSKIISDVEEFEWASGKPENKNDKAGCIAMNNEGFFEDIDCSVHLPFVCYKKSAEPVQYLSMQCNTVDPEYRQDPQSGHCYKFHSMPRTWYKAFMTCKAEGGYLAVINSKKEAEMLTNLYKTNITTPKLNYVGEYVKNYVFVGFHDWYERGGEFRTIHGQTLSEAGYDTFEAKQPNNEKPGQFCGGMGKTGQFNDLFCDKRTFFICESDNITSTKRCI